MNVAAVLKESVRRLFADIGVSELRTLSDDGANRTWSIAHAGGCWVAKFPERDRGLTIAPQLEYELLQLAADRGVGPRPIAFDSVTGIIFVEQLNAGSVSSAQQTSAHETYARIGNTLQRLHKISAPPSLRSFAPVAFSKAYCVGLRGKAQRDARGLREQCAELTAQCGHLLSGSSVCHNDLHPGNVLAGERLWLIDFEYAVRGAPIVDVASYAAYHNLTDRAAMLLAQAILENDLPFSSAQLQLVVKIQRVLGELWEIARRDNNVGV